LVTAEVNRTKHQKEENKREDNFFLEEKIVGRTIWKRKQSDTERNNTEDTNLLP